MSDQDLRLEFWLNGVVLFAVSLFGLTGNAICLLVLPRMRVEQSNSTFYHLLKWLALIDSGFLITCILTFCISHLSTNFEEQMFPYLAPSLIPLLHIFLTGSIYSIVAVAVERFLSIKKPEFKNQGACFGYILPLVVFSVVYNFPKFFELKTVQPDAEGPLRAAPTPLRLNTEYMYLLLSSCIFTGLIPIVVLMILNHTTTAALKTNPNPKEKTSGFLLSSLTGILIVCHLPRTSLNVYEAIQKLWVGNDLAVPPEWMVDVSHIFLVLSSSLNLPVFLLQDSEFRGLLCTSCRRLVTSLLGLSCKPQPLHNNNVILEEELRTKLMFLQPEQRAYVP